MGTCLYGASVAPGKDPDAQIVISRALWELLTGTPSSWLDALWDTFAPTIVKVSTLCSLNVEDPPDLSVTQIADALAGNPVALLEAEQWAKAKLSYLAFVNNCICNGATPAGCAGAQYLLTGWVNSHPDSNVTAGNKFTAAEACDTDGFYVVGAPSGTTAGTATLWDNATHALLATQAYPATANGVRNFVAWTGGRIHLANGAAYIIAWNRTAANNTPFNASGPAVTYTPYGAQATHWFYALGLSTFPVNDAGVGIMGIELSVCNSTAPTTPPAVTEPTQPTTLVLPPAWDCATACDIMVRLQQLSDRLDWLRRDVTLLQRYGTPFGYVAGTAHTGLTGTGTFAIDRAIGFQVILSAVPGGTLVLPGNPVYLWNQGWMAVEDGLGMIAEKRITRQSMTWLPDDCQLALTFSYQLNPGVAIDVVPLLAEP